MSEPIGNPSTPQFDQQARLGADMSGYRREVSMSTAATLGLLNAITAVQKKADGMSNRAGNRLLAGGFGIGATLMADLAVAANYQKQMSTIEATNKVTGQSFVKARKDIDTMAKGLPVTRRELIGMYTDLQNLGVKGPRELDKLSKGFIKLEAVTGDRGIGQNLIQFNRAMGQDSVATLDKYSSALVKVTKEQGVSAQGTLDFAQNIAPYTRAIGIGAADTLGFAAAFQKAGADGYSASNTFNQMLADITRSIQNGSPKIAQYANLIGKSTEEFANMDKADAVVQIFESIGAAGPDAIRILDRMGIDGLRAAKAVTQVSQSSGGLRQALDQAREGAKSPNLVDQAAAEAMAGLSDETQKFLNQLEQIAKVWGDSLVPWATRFMEIMNAVLKPITSITSALAPILGPVSATSALALLAGGAMLKGYKAATMVATGAYVARSGAVAAPVAGFMNAASQATGRPVPAPFRRGAAGWEQAVDKGVARPWQQSFYGMGAGAGGLAGPGSRGGSMIGQAASVPARVGSWWWNMAAQGYADGRKPGYMRDGMFGGGPMLMGAGGSLRETFLERKDAMKVTAAREAAALKMMSPAQLMMSAERMALGQSQEAEERKAAKIAQRSGLSSIPRDATAAQTGTTVASAQNFSKSLETAAKQTRTFGSTAISAGGSLAKAIGQATATTANVAGGAARGLAGMIPGPQMMAMIGISAAAAGVAADKAAKQKQANLPDDFKYTFQSVDESLGRAGTAIGSFAETVVKQQKALKKSTSMTEAEQFNADEIALAAASPNDYTTKSVAGLQNSEQAAAFLRLNKDSLDPERFDSLQRDIARAIGAAGAEAASQKYSGLSMDEATKTMDASITGGQTGWQKAMDVVSLGKGALFGGMTAWGGLGDQANQALDMRVASIQQQKATSTEKYGSQAATQESLNSTLDLLQNVASKGDLLEVNTTVSKLQGSGLLPQGVKGSDLMFDVKEGQTAAQSLTGQGRSNADIKEWLDLMAANGATTGYANEQGRSEGFGGWINSKIGNVEPLETKDKGGEAARERAFRDLTQAKNDEVQNRIDATKLGAASMSPTIQAVTGPGGTPEDQSKQLKASTELADAAKGAGGSLRGAEQELRKFQAAVKDSSDERYKTAELARQQISFERGIEKQGYTRAQTVQSSTKAYTDQLAIPEDQRNPETYAQDTQAAKQQMLQDQEGYRQYLAGLSKMIEQYNTSRQRAIEDGNRQARYANEDYQQQVLRSTQDFHEQMRYAEEDYAKSRNRAQRDFDKSATRQAEDAAKGMYDVYARAQSQYTMGAASLLTNLESQNKLMKDQASNVNKLSAMGLSDNVINQLGLTDPKNRQQAQNLVADLAADPSLIAKFNSSIEGRLDVSKGLTQNKHSDAWKRMNEDFQTSAKDAEEDFNTSMERARAGFEKQLRRGAEDLAKGLSRMREQQNTALTRAAEDFIFAQKEVTGAISDLAVKATADIAASFPGMGDAMVAEIDKVVLAYQSGKTAIDTGTPYQPRRATDSGTPDSKPRTTARNATRNATGGIYDRPTFGLLAELPGLKEAAIPLSPTGAGFMTEMVAMVVKQLGRTHLTSSSGGAVYTDQSQTINGVTVMANNPDEMGAKLAEKQRRRQLVRPRHGGAK